MNKYKHGFILGKFYPYHNGHKYLIESALEKCDIVTVLVCSISDEKICGEVRKQWIKDDFIFNRKLEIKLRTYDGLPGYPRNDHDEEFWKIWIDIIKEEVKNDIDVIFTSENYGNELVKRLNDNCVFNGKIENEIVDLYRKVIPISATQIRNNPFNNFKYLPNVVKPYFNKKITIVGPESVGKTTMTKLLAQYFETNYVLEYGRDAYEDILSINQVFDEKAAISVMSNQMKKVMNGLMKSNKVIFSDTETITTLCWYEWLNNKKSQIVSDRCEQFLNDENFKFDLYLLLTPDVAWIQDGTRLFPSERIKHFFRIKNELEKRNLNFKIIDGPKYNERFELSIKYINEFLQNIKWNL